MIITNPLSESGRREAAEGWENNKKKAKEKQNKWKECSSVGEFRLLSPQPVLPDSKIS